MDSNGLYKIKEIKEILELSKDEITLYVFKFSQYFSTNCKPEKGCERQFTIDDVKKLSYIHYYWEQDPDIESIISGLNQEEYLDYPFNNVYYELTPIIREDFENINGESDNYIYFSRSIYDSSWELANEYFSAAKLLLLKAKDRSEPWKKVFPILFNLRHGIELYLKAMIDKEMTDTHDLNIVYNQLKLESKLDFGKQFINLIETLDRYDKGTTFRYRDKKNQYEEKFLDVNLTLKHIEHFEKTVEQFISFKKES